MDSPQAAVRNRIEASRGLRTFSFVSGETAAPYVFSQDGVIFVPSIGGEGVRGGNEDPTFHVGMRRVKNKAYRFSLMHTLSVRKTADREKGTYRYQRQNSLVLKIKTY